MGKEGKNCGFQSLTHLFRYFLSLVSYFKINSSTKNQIYQETQSSAKRDAQPGDDSWLKQSMYTKALPLTGSHA